MTFYKKHFFLKDCQLQYISQANTFKIKELQPYFSWWLVNKKNLLFFLLWFVNIEMNISVIYIEI